MSGNLNKIVTDDWSDPASRALYEAQWPHEPKCLLAYQEGRQCGGCNFFAPFNVDWGLCANPASRHRLETVFEHFTCPSHVEEGWGPHSFTADTDYHCLCKGEADYWRAVVETARPDEGPK